MIERGMRCTYSPQGPSETEGYAGSVAAAPSGEERLRLRKLSGVHYETVKKPQCNLGLLSLVDVLLLLPNEDRLELGDDALEPLHPLFV